MGLLKDSFVIIVSFGLDFSFMPPAPADKSSLRGWLFSFSLNGPSNLFFLNY